MSSEACIFYRSCSICHDFRLSNLNIEINIQFNGYFQIDSSKKSQTDFYSKKNATNIRNDLPIITQRILTNDHQRRIQQLCQLVKIDEPYLKKRVTEST